MGVLDTLTTNAAKARAKAREAEAAAEAERAAIKERKTAARLDEHRRILAAYDPAAHRRAVTDAETAVLQWVEGTPLGHLLTTVAEAQAEERYARQAAATLQKAGEDAHADDLKLRFRLASGGGPGNSIIDWVTKILRTAVETTFKERGQSTRDGRRGQVQAADEAVPADGGPGPDTKGTR